MSVTRISRLALMCLLAAGASFGTCVPLWAGININTSVVEKAVVFIYPAKNDGSVDKLRPEATGFWVGVPLKNNPSRMYFVLVTARHVFDPIWRGCSDQNPSRFFLRLNLKKPAMDGSRICFLPLALSKDGGPIYFTNGDTDSDVAVMLVREDDLKDYDVGFIPLADFGTPEETGRLTVGDGVVSAGLLPAFAGLGRNYPVFKFGSISNIPNESIPVPCPSPVPQTTKPKMSARVWLLAVNLVPGNSGSPIFFSPFGASGVAIGGGRAMLIGLQSIAFLGADVSGMTPVESIFQAIVRMQLPDVDLVRGRGPTPPPPPEKK